MTRRRSPRCVATATALLLTASCASISPPPPSDVGLWPDAAGRIESERLGSTTEAHWTGYLAAHPEFASSLGDPRFHGDLRDLSPVARQSRRDDLWSIQRRLETLGDAELGSDDRLNLDLLLRSVVSESELLASGYDEWDPGAVMDMLVATSTLPSVQPVATEREREQLLARWSAVPETIRRSREALLRARSRGVVASRPVIDRLVAACDGILADAPMDHPLLRPAMGGGRWVELPPDVTLASIATAELGDAAAQIELRKINRHVQRGDVRALGTRVLIPAPGDHLTPDERGRFLEQVLSLVELEIQPAIANLRATLIDDLGERARDPQRCGLVHLAGGRELFWTLVARELGEGVATREDYARIVADVDALRSSVAVGARSAFDANDPAQLRAALRADAAASLDGSISVLAALDARAREVRTQLPATFGTIPATSFQLEEMWGPVTGEMETFVLQPGSARRPARVFVDAARLSRRSIHEVRALSLVELLPGRHLWTTSAIENPMLPRFRRHLTTESSSRGFGLYTLAIADELGIVDEAGDQLGADLVRLLAASLAAMDFAVHHDGWGRIEALEFLKSHVPHDAVDLEVELDRVIARPGLAFSTWMTARTFERLFESERVARGPAFDAARYHRQLLDSGPLPAGYLVRAVAPR